MLIRYILPRKRSCGQYEFDSKMSPADSMNVVKLVLVRLLEIDIESMNWIHSPNRNLSWVTIHV